MKFPAFGRSISKLPQPEGKAVMPERVTMSHRMLLTLSELFDSVKTTGQSSVDFLIRQKHKNAVDENEYPELDWLDPMKAQKQKADLERIERFKTSGL